MKIYLAAAFARQSEMRGVRDVLEAMGYRVTSRWIDVDVASMGLGPDGLSAAHFHDNPSACREFALRDIVDIVAADTVISFTDGERARGGRHVEFGMAYAWGKRIIVVGPREHIFHTLLIEHYPHWRDLARGMATWARDVRDAPKAV